MGIVYSAAAQHTPQSSRSDTGTLNSVAANLQSQLLSLWLDKVVRCKTADRFRMMVGMCHGLRI